MKIKIVVLLALLCVVLVTVLIAQQSPQKTLGVPQRYQLISAQVEDTDTNGNNVTSHAAFLVDTSSGAVWRYEPLVITKLDGGKSHLSFDRFYPVKIDVSRLPSE